MTRKQAKAQRPITLNPGYLVVDMTTVRGGVTYQQKHVAEHYSHGGYEKTYEARKEIDHVEAVQNCIRLRSAARAILEKSCTDAPFGWFAPRENVAGIRAAFADLEREADDANAQAVRYGSAAHIEIGVAILPFELGALAAEDPTLPRTICRSIHRILSEIRDAAAASDLKGLTNAAVRARNLEHMTVGICREVVVAALQSIPQIRKDIRASAQLDLGALDNAIAWYDPAGIGGAGDTSVRDAADAAVEAA